MGELFSEETTRDLWPNGLYYGISPNLKNSTQRPQTIMPAQPPVRQRRRRSRKAKMTRRPHPRPITALRPKQINITM